MHYIIIIYLIGHAYLYQPKLKRPMNWADDSTEGDLFFDRIVPLVIDIPHYKGSEFNTTVIAPGVFIDGWRILTSYNPFRELIRDAAMITKTVAVALKGRIKLANNVFRYYIESYAIECGRQIVYLPEDQLGPDEWHGADKKHTPLHDLMVLRINKEIQFSNLKPNECTLNNFPDNRQTSKSPKPFKTELAGPGDRMEMPMKFASVGYRNNSEIRIFRYLRVTHYYEDEHVIEDCDAWLPRSWGYFICILNIHKFSGIGSGAMLVSNNKLFGVGSFALFKGNNSVLVFTDVRPYINLINNTCMLNDTIPD